MNVAEYIVSVLKKNRITHVFGYQGGNITYMIDAISREDEISYIQAYHEQGAAFAANAYAQVSENFGVSISSSGPGAINMMNGIANAYYDSIPCLFITGNINTASMRESELIRQNGFQEADIVSMVKCITKYAETVRDPQELPAKLDRAIQIMQEGRKGPVLLDIPHNIQRMEVKEVQFKEHDLNRNDIVKQSMDDAVNVIKRSKKMVVLLGNGCRTKNCREMVIQFLEKTHIPAVCSLCGIDVIPNDHPCYRGMIGSYGIPYSNKVLNEADVVLVLGSRMDERQRTVSLNEFLTDAKVIHVDIDQNELRHVNKNEIAIECLVEDFLREILRKEWTEKQFDEWLNETATWMTEPVPENVWIYGTELKNKLGALIGCKLSDTIVTVDVGNHQMAAAQTVLLGERSRYLNSAGLGSMGYALPAAIGAYYADSDKRIICIAGDGGIMMNLQELELIQREHIPISIIVVNNKGLGMIESYQKLAFDGRVYGSKWGYEVADFSKIADAFGITYIKDGTDSTDEKWKAKQKFIEIEVL